MYRVCSKRTRGELEHFLNTAMLAELRGIWHREQCVRACVTGFPPLLRHAPAEQGSIDRRQVCCRRNCQARDHRTAAAILFNQAGNQASHPPAKRRQTGQPLARSTSQAASGDSSAATAPPIKSIQGYCMIHRPQPSSELDARRKSSKPGRAQSAPSGSNCLQSMPPSRAQIWSDDADGGQLSGVWGGY